MHNTSVALMFHPLIKSTIHSTYICTYIVRPRVRYKFTPTHSSAIISLQLFVSSIFDWKIPQFVWCTICNILSTNSVHNVPHTPSQNRVGTSRFFRFVCCYMKSIQNVRLSSITLSNCILFVMISMLEFNSKKSKQIISNTIF